MSGCDECRRGLLKLGLAGAAVLALPACGGTAQSVEGDGGAPPDGGGDGDLDAGPDLDGASDDAADTGASDGACTPTCATGPKTLELPFSKYPKLQNVGGSALVTATGYKDPVCGESLVIVAQTSAGNYVAVSAACTHACCTVSYSSSRTEFTCPCHGSTFGPTGKVVNGPARSPLQSLSVCADECGVTVTLP